MEFIEVKRRGWQELVIQNQTQQQIQAYSRARMEQHPIPSSQSLWQEGFPLSSQVQRRPQPCPPIWQQEFRLSSRARQQEFRLSSRARQQESLAQRVSHPPVFARRHLPKVLQS
ncbi:hypothetical protein NC652_034216 [Populus alba x Populus x berolinensis]|nr:hypothetical protein NC652_034216 [Populus alba x Populus x berolinensis]